MRATAAAAQHNKITKNKIESSLCLFCAIDSFAFFSYTPVKYLRLL